MAGWDESSSVSGRANKARSPESVAGLFDTERPGGLHARVSRSLIHAILSGKFERGARLPSEPKLAETYDVSRPVVRQALERLRREGLIESRRGSGNYVTGVDEKIAERLLSNSRTPIQIRRMMDDIEFRLVMEPEAAFFAARRRGPADLERMAEALRKLEETHAAGAVAHHFDFLFHEAIAEATTNAHFLEALRSLEYQADDERIVMRHLVHFFPADRAAAVLLEHREILDLIRRRDAEAARNAMKIHIDEARLRLRDRVAKLANQVRPEPPPARRLTGHA